MFEIKYSHSILPLGKKVRPMDYLDYFIKRARKVKYLFKDATLVSFVFAVNSSVVSLLVL